MKNKYIYLLPILILLIITNLLLFNNNSKLNKDLTAANNRVTTVNYSAPSEIKEEVIDLKKQDPNYLSSSAYYGEKDLHSKIDKEEKGTFFQLTHTVSGNKFLTAFIGELEKDDLNIASDWTAEKLSTDSMWIPLSCASKPSYLISNRYYLIDDGLSLGDDHSTNHYYAIFDIQEKIFTRFGGNTVNGEQGKEKVLYVDVEDDKIIFYIDHRDNEGTLTEHPDFKHSSDYKERYIIKRIIDPATLQYDDYKINYTVPDNLSAYYVSSIRSVYNGQNLARVTEYNLLYLSESRDSFTGYFSEILPDTKEIVWNKSNNYNDLTNYSESLNYPNFSAERKELEEKIIASIITQNESDKIFFAEGPKSVAITRKLGNRIIFGAVTGSIINLQIGSYNPENNTVSLAFNISYKGGSEHYFLLTKIFR